MNADKKNEKQPPEISYEPRCEKFFKIIAFSFHFDKAAGQTEQHSLNMHIETQSWRECNHVHVTSDLNRYWSSRIHISRITSQGLFELTDKMKPQGLLSMSNIWDLDNVNEETGSWLPHRQVGVQPVARSSLTNSQSRLLPHVPLLPAIFPTDPLSLFLMNDRLALTFVRESIAFPLYTFYPKSSCVLLRL